MGFISVVLVLSFISFNCNIKLSSSRKNDILGSKSFISLSPNAIDMRPCSCAMPTFCSCCEIVTIFYTRDERRLCFNMVYSRNGLNVDLSLDTTIIASMAVANYRPFRMCASVPGLLLTSICVNVSDLNQLANIIVVCPRLEISTKIQRWQIGYLCQNISAMLPAGGIPPIMARPGSMPGAAMPSTGARPPPVPAPPGMAMIRPPAVGPAPVSAPPGMAMIRPPAVGPAPVPAPPGMATVRPPAVGPAPVPSPSPAMGIPPGMAGGIMPRPAPGAAMQPVTGIMMMVMRPAMMPAAMPAAPAAPRPPAAAPAAPAGAPPMPTTGAIVPRPADGLLYNLEPLYRLEIVDPSDNSTAGLANPALPNSMLLPLQSDEFEQRSANENVTDFTISDNAQQGEFDQTMDDKISTIEDAAESNTASKPTESTRILKRKKRQLDIFDIFQQSNRCDRAYRICITRSNNYIISKLRPTRFNVNINKNMQCERPTKIVHTSGENLCSFLTSTINNDSENYYRPTQSSSSSSDSLDAIIVHDDTDDDSTFYSQNYPQIAPIIPYNRPRIYSARKPPPILSELQEQLKNLTNDAIKISHL